MFVERLRLFVCKSFYKATDRHKRIEVVKCCKLTIMRDFIIWILIFTLCFAETVVSDRSFHDYEGVFKFKDLNYWSGQCTTGKMQSPIELNRKLATELEFVELNLKGYEANQEKVTITNNGHSIMLSKFPHAMELSGLPWNENSTWLLQGISLRYLSEHMLNGSQHPLEVNMLHRNKLYKTNKEAAHHEDGFTVIAILFKERDVPKSPLQNISQDLHKVSSAANINQPKTLEHPLVVKKLLLERMGFYQYDGSLLTPPCSEVVTWIVLDKTSYVTTAQLAEFKKVEFVEGPAGKPRPIQQLNNRSLDLYTTGHRWAKRRRIGLANIPLPMGGALLCCLAAVTFVCM